MSTKLKLIRRAAMALIAIGSLQAATMNAGNADVLLSGNTCHASGGNAYDLDQITYWFGGIGWSHQVDDDSRALVDCPLPRESEVTQYNSIIFSVRDFDPNHDFSCGYYAVSQYGTAGGWSGWQSSFGTGNQQISVPVPPIADWYFNWVRCYLVEQYNGQNSRLMRIRVVPE